MKKYGLMIFLTLFGLTYLWRWDFPALAQPQMAALSGLGLTQIKITGDEYVVIQNGTAGPVDLSGYWLYEFNKQNPLAAGANSSTQQLPAAMLDAGQTLLLSSAGQNTCGAEVAGKLSLSLGDTSGSLELLASSNGLINPLPLDIVSWGADSSGTSAIIPSLPSSSGKKAGDMYYHGAAGWQLAELDASVPCQLDVASQGNVNVAVVPSSGNVPSVLVVGSSMPDDDAGLAAPKLSEILPNPTPPQTDADDEFIELYNANSKPFDLGGFSLQVGLTTTHKYAFPAGTIMQPQQFTAFYASETDLSLSNGGGQVKLLDPGGNVLEQSDVYGTAKDGYAWVYADGLWQWTTKPTPGAKNIITSPPAAKSSSSKSSSSGKVLGASTAAGGSDSGGGPSRPSSSPVHPAILAGIGSAAVLYALYEYRHDLANTLYRFRRYRAARRGAGQVAETAGSVRTAV